jgi:hypothetical protein
MAEQFVSPTLAVKAGNTAQIRLAKQSDPVYLALTKWNNEMALSGATPGGMEEPVRDDRGYSVAGEPKPLSRPQVKVAWREVMGFQSGPEVRFEERDDGLHLIVAFEEDLARRVPGTEPFNVQVKAVRLSYGSGANDILEFPDPLQEPLDLDKGPAFRIEAEAPVALDERRARIVAALQARDAAKWYVIMEFKWEHIINPPTSPPPPSQLPPRPLPNKMIASARPTSNARAMSFNATAAATAISMKPAIYQAILTTPVVKPVPQPTRIEKTYTFTRPLPAEYPRDAPENQAIFAAITGQYVQDGWRNTIQGWIQATPIRDTVYILPDAYRLQVDEVTGLPSIHALLLRKNPAGEMADPLDAANYKVRLTLKVCPDFDAERLNGLRAHIRQISSNGIPFADLVLGGFSSARFIPDSSLAGLGELFAGSTAGTLEAINPSETFMLTYEGNAEFMELLFQRLKGEGLGGNVEFDLQGRGGTTSKHSVPVVLTLRQMAPLRMRWNLVPPAALAEGQATDPSDLLPRDVTLRNSTPVEVSLTNIHAHALQRSPVTGRVDTWYRARPDGTWPRTLAPGASEVVHLTIEAEKPLCNGWDISLVDCRTKASSELVLNSVFDTTSSGVRGWKIVIDCPPMQFFDRLTPEDQAKMQDIVAIEVEVRRPGSDAIEEVRVTRQAPAGVALLSRTVADFVSDRATARSTFEYRQRNLRLTRADDWSPWRQETGSGVSVFLT